MLRMVKLISILEERFNLQNTTHFINTIKNGVDSNKFSILKHSEVEGIKIRVFRF